MNWVRFSLAVVGTSVALVVVLVATGGFIVGNALASGAPAFLWTQQHGSGPGDLPPELAGLKDIPADQRFDHFKGIQANLTDKDGKPIAISVVPGKASAVSASSLTLAGNDGASHTYALDQQTMTRGKSVANGDNVVIVTLNNSSSARAVIAVDPNGWHRFNN